MTLDDQDEFFKFCESLAFHSFTLYLLIRWSFTAYWGEEKKLVEKLRNKLDCSLLGKIKFSCHEEFNEGIFNIEIKEKENYSNYLSVLNDFYERLFKIPEKLKKYDKLKRNDKLKEYLLKITKAFAKEQNGYLNGIAFPLPEDSSIVIPLLFRMCAWCPNTPTPSPPRTACQSSSSSRPSAKRTP
jgi:hypothetical protein